MGGSDALRDGNIALEAPSDDVLLPLAERARDRHRALSDILALKSFIRENPNRLQALVRAPFSVAANESRLLSTMQMPPFMRASNAEPLTLAKWQYDLLMAWRAAVVAGPMVALAAPGPLGAAMSRRSQERRAAVLNRLDNA
jgi:hypothetical protein